MQDQKKIKKKHGHHRRQNSIQFLQQQENLNTNKNFKKNKKSKINIKQDTSENDLVKKIIQKEIEVVKTKIISIESLEDDERDDQKVESGFQAFRQQKQLMVNLNGEKLKNFEKYCNNDNALSAIEENTEQENSSKKTYSSVYVEGKSHQKNQSSNFFSNENSVKNLNFRKNKPSDFQQDIKENASAFKTKKVENFKLQFYQNENDQLNQMFYKKTQKRDKSKNLHRKINSVTFQIGSNDDKILLEKPKLHQRSVSPNDLKEIQSKKKLRIYDKQAKNDFQVQNLEKKKKKSLFSKTFNNRKKREQQMPLLSKKKLKESVRKPKKAKVSKKSNKFITSDGFKFRKAKYFVKSSKNHLNITGEQLYQKSFVQNLIFKQPVSTRPNKRVTFLDKFF